MELNSAQLEKLPLDALKKMQSIDADLMIASRITAGDQQAINYLLGDFSAGFLDYIASAIMHRQPVCTGGAWHYYPTVTSEFYEFIGAAFVDGCPTWHKIGLYSGIATRGQRQARLYTYVSTITVRHFVHLKQKEDRQNAMTAKNISATMHENADIDTLLKYDGFDEINPDTLCDEESEFDWAWNRLPEKDRKTLTCLVVEERDTLEAFDLLAEYIDTDTPTSAYTRKQRQDAMSSMKRRAKKHLRQLIVEYRKKQKK